MSTSTRTGSEARGRFRSPIESKRTAAAWFKIATPRPRGTGLWPRPPRAARPQREGPRDDGGARHDAPPGEKRGYGSALALLLRTTPTHSVNAGSKPPQQHTVPLAQLFIGGKSLIGWYIGSSAVASTYGAAAGLIVYYCGSITQVRSFCLGPNSREHMPSCMAASDHQRRLKASFGLRRHDRPLAPNNHHALHDDHE